LNFAYILFIANINILLVNSVAFRFFKIAYNVRRLQEVAMNQDQAFTNINKTFN